MIGSISIARKLDSIPDDREYNPPSLTDVTMHMSIDNYSCRMEIFGFFPPTLYNRNSLVNKETNRDLCHCLISSPCSLSLNLLAIIKCTAIVIIILVSKRASQSTNVSRINGLTL